MAAVLLQSCLLLFWGMACSECSVGESMLAAACGGSPVQCRLRMSASVTNFACLLHTGLLILRAGGDPSCVLISW